MDADYKREYRESEPSQEHVDTVEDPQKALMLELRKGYLSMVATIERMYGLRRTVRCPHCGYRHS